MLEEEMSTEGPIYNTAMKGLILLKIWQSSTRAHHAKIHSWLYSLSVYGNNRLQ